MLTAPSEGMRDGWIERKGRWDFHLSLPTIPSQVIKLWPAVRLFLFAGAFFTFGYVARAAQQYDNTFSFANVRVLKAYSDLPGKHFRLALDPYTTRDEYDFNMCHKTDWKEGMVLRSLTYEELGDCKSTLSSKGEYTELIDVATGHYVDFRRIANATGQED